MVHPIWELMNIKNKYLFLLPALLVVCNPIPSFTQANPLAGGERGDIRIMFYNVENYFDTHDDTLTADEEFLPESEKNWNLFRYREKTLNLFKTLVAVGESRPPEIICFAEIENKRVLYELIRNTPLDKYKFEIIHFDSPDIRGIDVGLIFRKDLIHKIASQKINISFPFNSKRTTRDILYFKGLTANSDTLHIFINHWPSRRGGQQVSEPYRIYAAQVLRSKCDSILNLNSCANIIITGDFNDEPYNKSLSQALGAVSAEEQYHCSSLYNLSAMLGKECKCGTYRYRSHWNMLDQFIISGNLLLPQSNPKTGKECLHIAKFDFLLIEDKKYGGTKPFRTYQGPVYKGGFSDHLPIYLDLYY